MKDDQVTKDLALIARNAIAYIKDLEQQINELKRAAQPQRKPLTEEEMRECAQAMDAEPLAEGWPELIKFARAVERAHGIGDVK